jgi:hypothetical protein
MCERSITAEIGILALVNGERVQYIIPNVGKE